jgi:hypothetical protein
MGVMSVQRKAVVAQRRHCAPRSLAACQAGARSRRRFARPQARGPQRPHAEAPVITRFKEQKMAVVSKQVGTYKMLFMSGYSNKDQIGFIYFNDPAGAYFGYAGIMRSGAALPANVQWPNGILNLYFPESQLVALLDTLRNEKPVHVQFHTDLKWGSIGTEQEPVGEQEVPGR